MEQLLLILFFLFLRLSVVTNQIFLLISKTELDCFFRKPCSNYKMKEITGSGIFSVYEQNDALETGTRTYQVCVFFRFSKHFLVLFDYVI